jgi:hypothetical protein
LRELGIKPVVANLNAEANALDLEHGQPVPGEK